MRLITGSFLLAIFFTSKQDEAFANDLGSVSSCFPTEMRIVVNLTKNPDLVVSEMHLIDTNCKVTDNNATHARFDIPLNDCGTTRDGSNPDYIEFSNAVKWSPKPVGNELQTRKYDFESRIICRYDRNGSASVSIKPEQEITVSQTVYGKFSFVMEVFSDAERTRKLERDLPVIPGTPLHFRVQVLSAESALILHLDKCWARNQDFTGSHEFIEKGCNNGKDKTLDYDCANSTIQDFQIDAFRILNSPTDFVFFFCDVIVCLEKANASLCTDRCNNCTAGSNGGSRKRRSVEEESDYKYDQGSNTFSLVVGPYLVKEQDDGKDQKSQDDDDQTEVEEDELSSTMIIVLCVTSFAAIVLIWVTIMVIIWFRRWSTKHTAEHAQAGIPRRPKAFKL